jgi:cytochrome c oxidase subunit 1
LMVGGIIFMFVNLLKGFLKGEPASSDPWGGTTLEWSIPSPPALHNFIETPKVRSYPYDFKEAAKEKILSGKA